MPELACAGVVEVEILQAWERPVERHGRGRPLVRIPIELFVRENDARG
jgi:hypothetical protein